MTRLTIVGCGLIGGSLARAARRSIPDLELIGIDPSAETRSLAHASGVFDRLQETIDDKIVGSELTVLCVPIHVLSPTLGELDRYLDNSCVVTDTTGVKVPVIEIGRRMLHRAKFVGAHPMVGGHLGGFAHSRSTLFENARVVVCPGAQDETERVEVLWRKVGADIERMDAADHDRAVAITSHLPYVVALVLAEMSISEPHVERTAGPQWRDVTKRAGFAPGIMADASSHNAFLPSRLKQLAERMNQLAEQLEENPRVLRELAARVVETIETH